MLFRHPKPDRVPSTIPDPIIDAQIHWLGSRGLVKVDAVSRDEWIGATEDPTDPFSLVRARVDNMPCVRPEPAVAVGQGSYADMVNALADGLELPIDEVATEHGLLKLRSRTSHYTYDIEGHELLEVLQQVVRSFVDSAHVLIVVNSTFAIAHRDIADEVNDVMMLAGSIGFGDR